MADPTTLASALSTLKDEITKALAPWPGSDTSAPAAASTPATSTSASTTATPDSSSATTAAGVVSAQTADMGATVRQKYDAMIHWVVGAFAAVGILIFGSLPFTDLKGVSGAVFIGGLTLAGVGLGVVIWATTKGLEPQSISLGELAVSLKAAKDARWLGADSWRPRVAAMRRLERTLTAPQEAAAHLGPGIRTVPELIKRIGDLEILSLKGNVGWNGVGTASETLHPGDSWAASASYRTAAIPPMNAAVSAEYGSLAALITARAQLSPPAGTVVDGADKALQTLVPTIDQMIDDMRTRAAALAAATTPVEDSAQKDGIVAAQGAALAIYLGHRDLVLQEAAVAHMRGMFRLVRFWLLVGAALTLNGGVMYAHALSNRTSATTNPKYAAVTLTINPNTTPWKALKACQDKAKPITVMGLLTTADDSDAKRDGPFTAVVDDPRCAGTITVANGEGSYTPR